MDPLTTGYLIVLIVGLGTLLIWSRVRAALAARVEALLKERNILTEQVTAGRATRERLLVDLESLQRIIDNHRTAVLEATAERDEALAALAQRGATVDDLRMALDGLRGELKEARDKAVQHFTDFAVSQDDLGAAALQRDDAVEQLETLRQTHENLEECMQAVRVERGELVLDLQTAKQVIANTAKQRDAASGQRDMAWAAKDRATNDLLDVHTSLAAQLDKVREAEDQLRGLQEGLHVAIVERDGALLNLAGANARRCHAIDVLCGDAEIPLT